MNLEINKNIMCVDNYRQIKEIKSDLICLKDICIYGFDLKVLKLDDYSIVIKGIFKKIVLENEENDI